MIYGTPGPGEIEAWALSESHFPLLGIDEAGRGPLAGPVVAAAVALPVDHTLFDLDDSKKLSETERERLFPAICDAALAYGVGSVDARTIDRIGILPATFKAMRAAIRTATRGGLVPGLVVVDGSLPIPRLSHRQRPVVRGDGRSFNVAAASILAKVTRDRAMARFHEIWPHYGFAVHKGYGTAAHLAALREHGPCPIHRRSFRGVTIGLILAPGRVPKWDTEQT